MLMTLGRKFLHNNLHVLGAQARQHLDHCETEICQLIRSSQQMHRETYTSPSYRDSRWRRYPHRYSGISGARRRAWGCRSRYRGRKQWVAQPLPNLETPGAEGPAAARNLEARHERLGVQSPQAEGLAEARRTGSSESPAREGAAASVAHHILHRTPRRAGDTAAPRKDARQGRQIFQA